MLVKTTVKNVKQQRLKSQIWDKLGMQTYFEKCLVTLIISKYQKF